MAQAAPLTRCPQHWATAMGRRSGLGGNGEEAFALVAGLEAIPPLFQLAAGAVMGTLKSAASNRAVCSVVVTIAKGLVQGLSAPAPWPRPVEKLQKDLSIIAAGDVTTGLEHLRGRGQPELTRRLRQRSRLRTGEARPDTQWFADLNRVNPDTTVAQEVALKPGAAAWRRCLARHFSDPPKEPLFKDTAASNIPTGLQHPNLGGEQCEEPGRNEEEPANLKDKKRKRPNSRTSQLSASSARRRSATWATSHSSRTRRASRPNSCTSAYSASSTRRRSVTRALTHRSRI
mmetsp:Transcript_154351/g.474369  ORF Transcript_154351/g.474369 Transcript_154351/m.474369 type:complete len:288 (-) Transcript_154351:288-1151(-)